MNKADMDYIIPVLEEVRVYLNLDGPGLKDLIERNDLLKYLTGGYDTMHCFGYEEGVDSVIHWKLKKPERIEYTTLRHESTINGKLVDCVDLLSLSQNKSVEECYFAMLETEQYDRVINKLGWEHCIGSGAWASGICKELNWTKPL